jgi:hypothetical protein
MRHRASFHSIFANIEYDLVSKKMHIRRVFGICYFFFFGAGRIISSGRWDTRFTKPWRFETFGVLIEILPAIYTAP